MKNFLFLLMCVVALQCLAENADPEPPAPSKPDGIIGGHEYVDLGLPSGTLWATCNVGANSPYETGGYFAWGEVEPREDFSWESYQLLEGFDSDPDLGAWAILKNVGTDIRGTQYDAARHQWGNGWRLPSKDERYELLMLCWNNGATVENGVSGIRIYGPNKHSIFLPICGLGLWYGEQDASHDHYSAYWTGVEDPNYIVVTDNPSDYAHGFSVDCYGGLTGASCLKSYGCSVRAVINPRQAGIDNITADIDKVNLTYNKGSISITGDRKEGLITVYDLSGRLIFSGYATDGICLLPDLTNGVYLVSCACDGNIITTQKISIK